MTYNAKIVLAYFKDCGLPEPAREFVFAPPRKWRFDFAWMRYEGIDFGGPKTYLPIPVLALEVEGGIWTHGRHTRGSGFVKDMEKYNEAAAMGYRIIRVQPKDLCTQETVELIKRCLA